MRRRWIETEKAKVGGRRWRRQGRDVTDNFIEQSGKLDGGVCQAEGSGCDLQDGRLETERDFRSVSLMNLSILSLSADKSLQTLSSFLAGKRQPRMAVEGRQMSTARAQLEGFGHTPSLSSRCNNRP